MNKKMTIEKLKAVIVGYGNRGQVYADYSLDCPEQLEIIGIVDPNPFKLNEAKERYGLSDNALFTQIPPMLFTNPDPLRLSEMEGAFSF